MEGILLCSIIKGGEGHGTAVKGTYPKGRRYRVRK